MNWVAHFVLSEQNENLIVGNWLGDVVKGKDYENYAPEIKKGILLHRTIDSYTDEHPFVKEATQIFRPTQSKYAPIVVDLLGDYFLIQNWDQFYPDSYETFSYEIYRILKNHIDLYPNDLQERTKALVRYNWFQKYKTLDGIQQVLTEMSQRTQYPNQMDTAVKEVYTHEKLLNEIFLDFFPKLIKHSHQFIHYYDL